MRRKFVSILLAVTIFCTGISSNILASNIKENKTNKIMSKRSYKYDSLENVKKGIEQAYNDGEITMSEHYDINSHTSQKVKEQFIMEEMNRISKLDIDLSVSSNEPQKTIEVGNGTKITVKMEDFSERTGFDLCENLKSLFITDVFAGSSEKTVTKEYGNRYCSATVNIAFILGVASFRVENHYKLGKNGITERYGSSAVTVSYSYGGNVSIEDGVITDDVATKPGASNTNMYFKYSVSCSNFGVNYDRNGFIHSVLSYKSIDTKKKTITLSQKFTW